MTLQEYLANHKPKGFEPIPRFSVDGNFIEWWWEDVAAYSEPVHHDGKWIGSVHRANTDSRVVGMTVNLESVMGLLGDIRGGRDGPVL